MRRRISALRTFFGWCVRTERLERDPTLTLNLPRAPKHPPKALEESEARALLAAAAGGPWPARDVAIVTTALGVGPRLSEIAGLTLRRVVGRPPEALDLLGKGNRERRVWLPPRVSEVLAAWLEERERWLRANAYRSEALFLSSRPRRRPQAGGGGVAWDVGLHGDGVAEVVLGCLARAGIAAPGRRVHVLRHTFATQALSSDAYNLRELQETLGHTSLATTALYTKVTEEGLRRAAARHPLGTATP